MSILFGIGYAKTLYLLAGLAICLTIAVVGTICLSRSLDMTVEPNVGSEGE